MSTSMPYGAQRVIVTRDHIEDLRVHGRGACLTWHEDTHQVQAVGPRAATDPRRMIIIGYQGLGEVSEHHAENGDEVTDEDLARDLTDIASDWRAEWPEIRAMNLQVHDLRRALTDAGAYLASAPTFQLPIRGLPQMTDYYTLAGSTRLAQVTVSFGFIEPTRITASDPDDDTRPIADLTLGTGGTLTHAATSRLIASTVTCALNQDR
ncbi:hypothetical protein NGM33_10950 [Nocardiopsis dassonvillei]|uniref:hypothetical protein n=1 Tax=Nocardiopsis dassonvillei TaxID=2014 RepID=UPI0020A3F93D|nr:hypothetical protein [Nocardiopsis dassonvillei]MCP3013848.1 hypothetical protein [Nocardiopsis dassonvillei]